MATIPTKTPELMGQKRSRHSPLRDVVRAFNRRILNPVMLRFAGRPGFYAAVVRHVGRRSGRAFATPVVAAPTIDGFAIPLPYGADTDWCRNILAAGGCTVQYQGMTYQTDAPRIVTAAEAMPVFSERHQRSFRRFRIGQFLRLHFVDMPSTTTR